MILFNESVSVMQLILFFISLTYSSKTTNGTIKQCGAITKKKSKFTMNNDALNILLTRNGVVSQKTHEKSQILIPQKDSNYRKHYGLQASTSIDNTIQEDIVYDNSTSYESTEHGNTEIDGLLLNKTEIDDFSKERNDNNTMNIVLNGPISDSSENDSLVTKEYNNLTISAEKNNDYICIDLTNEESTDSSSSIKEEKTVSKVKYIQILQYSDRDISYLFSRYFECLNFHIPLKFHDNLNYKDFFSKFKSNLKYNLSDSESKYIFYAETKTKTFPSIKLDLISGIHYIQSFCAVKKKKKIQTFFIPPIFKDIYERYKNRLELQDMCNFTTDLENDLNNLMIENISVPGYNKDDPFYLHKKYPNENRSQILNNLDEISKKFDFKLPDDEIKKIKNLKKQIANLLCCKSYKDFQEKYFAIFTSSSFKSAIKSINKIKFPNELNSYIDSQKKILRIKKSGNFNFCLHWSDYYEFFENNFYVNNYFKSFLYNFKFSFKKSKLGSYRFENTSLKKSIENLFKAIVDFCEIVSPRQKYKNIKLVAFDPEIDMDFDDLRLSNSDLVLFFRYLERSNDNLSHILLKTMEKSQDRISNRISAILSKNGIDLPKQYVDPYFGVIIKEPMCLKHTPYPIFMDKDTFSKWHESNSNLNDKKPPKNNLNSDPLINFSPENLNPKLNFENLRIFLDTRKLYQILISDYYEYVFSD